MRESDRGEHYPHSTHRHSQDEDLREANLNSYQADIDDHVLQCEDEVDEVDEEEEPLGVTYQTSKNLHETDHLPSVRIVKPPSGNNKKRRPFSTSEHPEKQHQNYQMEHHPEQHRTQDRGEEEHVRQITHDTNFSSHGKALPRNHSGGRRPISVRSRSSRRLFKNATTVGALSN